MEVTTATPAEASTGSRTIADLMALAVRKHGDRVAVRQKRDGAWQSLTYSQVGEIVRFCGGAWEIASVEAGDSDCRRIRLVRCTTEPADVEAHRVASVTAIAPITSLIPQRPTMLRRTSSSISSRLRRR